MKKVLLVFVFTVSTWSLYSQTSLLYGLWLDNMNQKFVSVNKNTGERTVIANISGNPGYVLGSSAANADSGQYIFVGFTDNPATYRIYTIDINNGSVISSPLNPPSATEYEFDPVTNKLYGLWLNNGIQNFISVNKYNGERTVINSINGNQGVVSGSAAFNADGREYYFVGFSDDTYKLYTIDITDGTIVSNPLNPAGAGEYQYDPVTNKLYGLWLDNGIQNFISIDKTSGEKTVLNSITGNPAVVNGSSAFNSDSAEYIFIGITDQYTTYKIYTINIIDGAVKSSPINPENTGAYELITSGNIINSTSFPLNNNDPEIYPIPLTSKLTIKNLIDIECIRIYNVYGQLQKQFIPDSKDMVSYDLSGLQEGTYIISLIKPNSQIFNEKIIIKK